MKEFPILFSAPMVNANRAGLKCMTRRVIDMERLKIIFRETTKVGTFGDVLYAGKKYPAHIANELGVLTCETPQFTYSAFFHPFDFICPYAQGETNFDVDILGCWHYSISPHDSRLWVRETWRLFDGVDECPHADFPCSCPEHGTPLYRATDDDGESKWNPSIFMPRWACRDTYTVLSVRIERLQCITEEDAIKEGVELVRMLNDKRIYLDYLTDSYAKSAQDSYRTLWDSINAKRHGCTWDDNPWVWVIEYDNPQWNARVAS